MRTLALTIFSLAFGVQFGHGASIPDNGSSWYSYVGTKRYVFRVTNSEMSKTPVWREQDEHPPLAARKALRLARTRLVEIVKSSRDWRLHSLSLCEWGDKRHWYYIAAYDVPVPYIDGPPLTMRIPVLMSGDAVKPKVSRWTR